MKHKAGHIRHFILLAFCLILLASCGEDNVITGEDHGNIAASESGIILTQSEHEIGWGKATCFDCHNTDNIHQTDRTGTGLNLEAIRELTKDEGVASCATCHGDNGVE